MKIKSEPMYYEERDVLAEIILKALSGLGMDLSTDESEEFLEVFDKAIDPYTEGKYRE